MKRTAFTLIMLVMCSFAAFAQRNATITGTIVDAQMKDYLTGATVVVMGGTEGTIADANGSYRLTIPTGKQTIQYSFLGYITQEVEIDLKANEIKVIDIAMKSDTELLEGVVVSAQAKGKAAAINSQINASGIMNAVSGERLSELPDVNVADAIGRLPGLMIQRDGGEGQKIVIRGLSPKYNTVSFNGMTAPSTSDTDRSTDLNMISPDMIASAEVMKANTADKDADGLGGTVNLVLKDAPEGFRLSLNGETGYHSQINNIGRYKGGLTLSNRFFKSRLGMILAASYDRTDRSNDTFSASYNTVGDEPTPGYGFLFPLLLLASSRIIQQRTGQQSILPMPSVIFHRKTNQLLRLQRLERFVQGNEIQQTEAGFFLGRQLTVMRQHLMQQHIGFFRLTVMQQHFCLLHHMLAV